MADGKYKVLFVSGSYGDRQREADRWGADWYVEMHANSVDSSEPDYALAVIGANASRISESIARHMAPLMGAAFDVGGEGDVDIYAPSGVRRGGRGNANVSVTRAYSVLLEPGFASNPEQARRMESDEGLTEMAAIIDATARRFFPGGARIAFSVGHKGKPNSKDMGAVWRGERFRWEAEYAEAVLLRAAAMLTVNERAVLAAEYARGASVVPADAPQFATVTVATRLRAAPQWGREFSVGAEIAPGGRVDFVPDVPELIGWRYARNAYGQFGWISKTALGAANG